MSDWKCGVCDYIHKEDEAPDTCPVCEAPKKKFVDLSSDNVEKGGERVDEKSAGSTSNAVKQWRCTICGYVHTGSAPPEKCPVCGASAEYFEELVEDESKNAQKKEAASDRRWRCTVCG